MTAKSTLEGIDPDLTLAAVAAGSRFPFRPPLFIVLAGGPAAR